MNWGRRAILAPVTLVVVAATSCGAERIESAIDAPLPDYVVPCDERYEEGKLIEYGPDGDFAKACRMPDEELVTPVPAKLDCSEGPDLLYNEFAWGYDKAAMTLFAEDDTDRRPPEEERMACLRRDVASPGVEAAAEGEGEEG